MAEMIPDQHGRILLLNPANPAKGAEIVVTQPIRVRWALKSFQVKLATGLVVADRIPELYIQQDGVEAIRITGSQSLAASGTFIYGWMEGERALSVTGQTSRVTALPRKFYMNNQAVIGTLTVGIDMDDQYSNVVVVVEEWIEPLA